MSKIKAMNKELQEINEKLFIQNSLEDYSEDDMEEYGITDIEETRNLTLNYWHKVNSHSTVIKQNFWFSEPRSLIIPNRERDTLRHLGFNEQEILDIAAVFRKYS